MTQSTWQYETKVLTGEITNIQPARGFAFIRPDGKTDKASNVFCHASAVAVEFELLYVGLRVSYVETFNSVTNRIQAGAVRPIEG